MTDTPVILVSPNIETKGNEFGDMSLSLAETYQMALLSAGAIPLTMPATASRKVIAECVRRADGVLLPGGEDVDPALYANHLPAKLHRTVTVTADGGARDLREVILVDEVFRQHKPLLAICRGHQVLNVALGGTLVVDVASQVRGAINHRQLERKCQVVHAVQLTPDSLLARITGQRTLGVNSTHHQAVDRPADLLTVIGRSNDGVVEAMQLRADLAHLLPFLLSVQFHPERLADRHAPHRAIFKAFTRACAANRRRKL